MRHREGLHLEGADLFGLARAQDPGIQIGALQARLFEGPGGGVDRHPVPAREAGRAAHVVLVLVGEEEAVEGAAPGLDQSQPPLDLAAAEAGVHHQPAAAALHHQDVAGATRAECRQTQRRAFETERELHGGKLSQGRRPSPGRWRGQNR